MRKPRNRITVRNALDPSPYVMCRLTKDFGMQDSSISAMNGLTNIREAGRRIVVLAARSMTGSHGSINIVNGG